MSSRLYRRVETLFDPVVHLDRPHSCATLATKAGALHGADADRRAPHPADAKRLVAGEAA